MQKQYQQIFDSYFHGHTFQEAIDADVYLATWVVPDYLNLEGLLPGNLSGYVNLGCGAGLFDGIYLQGLRNTVHSVLVDKDPTCAQSVRQVAELNGLSNTTFHLVWPEASKPPEVVLSIRSCGFLFGVEAYDSLFRSLRDGSRVVLEVRNNKVKETNTTLTH